VYLEAINVRPGDWINNSRLGAFYQSQARYADAERAYRRVVDLAPDNYSGYRDLGVTLFSQGQTREAEKMLRKALDLRPAARVYLNLGAILMFEKRYPEAVPVMENAERLAPTEAATSYVLYGNLGDVYWLAKQSPQKMRAAWLKAADIVESQLTGTAADAERLGFLAEYRAKLGDRQEALRRVESAIDYSPDSAEVRYQAGLTYAILGEKELAIMEISKAIDRKKSVSEIQAAPELEPLRTDPTFAVLFHQPNRAPRP